MIIYILKFSACLALFLVFYKLVLEKENMHVFKRFYLLSTLLLSIGIPLITFTYYVEPSTEIFPLITQNIPLQKSAILLEPQINYTPIILWSIYGLGVFLFGVNFLRNLYALNYKIKHNPKQKNNRITNVLLKDLVIPHTFFNYIFLNKRKFETHQIPKEVFWHEETHAIQKHSIDVLFIEILQIVFWFNPLIYFLKHVVKLNHEFLADQAVLKKGVETTTYQETLLAFSSNALYPQLANAINYSSIKKRFTVMKTQTTKKAIWLRSLILLPLLAITLYSFSSTQIIEKNIVSKTSITNHTARSVDIEVFNNGTYKIDDIKATKETFISVINQLHQDITPEIRNQIINVHVNSGKTVSDEEVWFIYNSFIDYGFHRIVTYNQEIIREKGNKPFATTNTGKQEHSKDIIEQQKATKDQIAEYNKLAKKYNNMSKDNMVIKRSDLERIKYLYDLMSVEQRKKAQPFPSFPAPPPPIPDIPEAPKANFPPPPPLTENATPKQIETYKRAYRDAQVADKILRSKAEKEKLVKVREISSVQDRERLKQKKLTYKEALIEVRTLKLKAQKEQLAKMQEVIDQESIASPQEKERIKKVRQAYAKKHPEKATKTKLSSGEVIDIVEIPFDDEGIVDIYDKSYKYIIKDGEMTYYDKNGKTLTEEDINKLPPPPNWPLKQVAEMAKKNALFFLDGKNIDSKKAIQLLKNNQKIIVGTEGINSKYPRVYLYTKNQ